ncbi:MAG: hypothetical protein FRX49_11185 [Trebouxia sp. A1-2]|nr:MAG: hypothetical protein FRX49_11185 [Trebouxia sp. A1-2]
MQESSSSVKICLGVDNVKELLTLRDQARLATAMVSDTEGGPPNRTVVAIGPGASSKIDAIIKQLKLYDQAVLKNAVKDKRMPAQKFRHKADRLVTEDYWSIGPTSSLKQEMAKPYISSTHPHSCSTIGYSPDEVLHVQQD